MSELTSGVTTHFAPAERAAIGTLTRQHALLRGDRTLVRVMDGFPEPAMVLNRQRQIVLANDKLAALLGRSCESLVGLRPGEAFGCVHADECDAGCGTTRSCRYCGAVNAILGSQAAHAARSAECRMRHASGDASDLLIWSTPLPVQGEEFTLLTLRDTTDEHRRQALERLFFHDILNTAGGLQGLLDLLHDGAATEAAEVAELTDRAFQLANQLIEEIQAQRALAAAEAGTLQVAPAPLDADALLAELHALYAPMAALRGVGLPPPRCEGATTVVADRLLLRRALGNLLKNAIEASRRGAAVDVSFTNDGAPRFRVHNDGAMSEDVRLQIFQRSFTTKGERGHGLGTYSVKLFTERYLGGRVALESDAATGTTFTLSLPPA